MKHKHLLPSLFCIFLFACKKNLDSNATDAKSENIAIKPGSYKNFSTDKQTQAIISKFIQDSIHDFKTLDSYLSQFLTTKFKSPPTRKNSTSGIETLSDSYEPDNVNSYSWSQYYNESGNYYGDLENEFDYSTGNGYSFAIFEGIAYGTSTFEKRHNTIVINFPYAYRISANTRRYLYSLASHNLIANLTGPALGELEYAAAYAYNVANVDHATYDGQIEGFVSIREKRTRIVDDHFNIIFKAGLKAEIFEIGTELEGGRKVQSVSNTIGDYSINIFLMLLTPMGAGDVLVQWTYWGDQYPYPKPTYYMQINGTNLDYQQN